MPGPLTVEIAVEITRDDEGRPWIVHAYFKDGGKTLALFAVGPETGEV